MDTYISSDQTGAIVDVAEAFDYFFTFLFAAESLVKTLSYGLFFDKNS